MPIYTLYEGDYSRRRISFIRLNNGHFQTYNKEDFAWACIVMRHLQFNMDA